MAAGIVVSTRVLSGMCLGFHVSPTLQLQPAAVAVAGLNRKVLNGLYTLFGLFGTSAG